MAKSMDATSMTAKLCIEGIRAEFEGRVDDARALYQQAWNVSANDYDACIAAHYVARFQTNPHDMLKWNQEALARADAVGDERVQAFYPSLYVNLGHSYELLGNQSQATHYYNLAADLGLAHQVDSKPTVVDDDLFAEPVILEHDKSEAITTTRETKMKEEKRRAAEASGKKRCNNEYFR